MEVEDKGVAMRELFTIDLKNYKENGTVGKRPSVRGIIIKDGKIAMMYSLKYDYYKLPGGGIEEGEELRDTLVREVKEESGLVVKKETIKEFGYVRRIEKGMFEDIFMQENYYFLCDNVGIFFCNGNCIFIIKSYPAKKHGRKRKQEGKACVRVIRKV